MSEIISITEEQKKLFNAYSTKWFDIGIKTGTCNREKIIESAKKCYALLNRKFPENIYWEKSPFAGVRRVRSLLKDSTQNVDVSTILDNACYGQHEVSWLSFYAFLKDQFNLNELNALDSLFEMTECGWWWPLDEAVVLTERPVSLKTDATGKLHCESDACITYADGFKLYAWRGIFVPKDVIVHPELITLESIEQEKIEVIKKVKIARYGTIKYLLQVNCDLIHSDDWGALYSKKVNNINHPYRMVKVLNCIREMNGTYNDSYIHVHHELRPLHPDGELGQAQELTALNAIASTYGLTGKEYLKRIESCNF